MVLQYFACNILQQNSCAINRKSLGFLSDKTIAINNSATSPFESLTDSLETEVPHQINDIRGPTIPIFTVLNDVFGYGNVSNGDVAV